MTDSILERVRAAARNWLLFLPHTIRRMSRPERMMTTAEIEVIVMTGEVMFEAREVDLIQAALAGLDREADTLIGQSAT